MESALSEHLIPFVVGYTGYKNAVGAASCALRLAWSRAGIQDFPEVFVFCSGGTVVALDLRKCTWSIKSGIPETTYLGPIDQEGFDNG